MAWKIRYRLPERARGPGASLRFLKGLQAYIADCVHQELARGGLEEHWYVRVQDAESDFGGYWSWRVEILQDRKLAATIAIERSSSAGSDDFHVHWQDVDASSRVRFFLALGCAAAGLAAGSFVSGDAALLGLFTSGSSGALAHLAWCKLIGTKCATASLDLRAAIEPIIANLEPVGAAA